MYKNIITILIATSLAGCATTKDSIFTGAAVGSATGALMGQAKSKNSKGTMIGLGVGAAVGGLIGYLAHKSKKKKMTARPPEPLEVPNLTRPKVRMYWVPDSIDDDKFIERHRVWVLEKSPEWTRSKSKKKKSKTKKK